MEVKMKIKNIKIEVKPFEENIKEAIKAYEDISKRRKVKDRRIVFEDLNTLRSIITKERLKLLHVIKEKKPSSIYELAKLTNRKWRAVSNDVSILEKVGLLELRKSHKPVEVIKPIINFNRLEIGIEV